MAGKQLLVAVFILFTFLGLNAQIPALPKWVNVHFLNTPLHEVLEHFRSNYKLQFSYSKEHLALEQKISFDSRNLSLDKTIIKLFKEHQIIYSKIGNQWVLKGYSKPKKRQVKKKKRAEERKKRQQKTLQRGTLFERNFYSEIILTEGLQNTEKRVFSTQMIQPIEVNKLGQTSLGNINIYSPQNPVTALQKRPQKVYFGQLSVLPFIGTNGVFNNRQHALSFNLLWGMNAGINGLEIGIMGNSLRKQLRGIQIGGFFNHINGEALGYQMAGLLNMVKGKVLGMQVAGLWNLSGNLFGTQFSTIANLSNNMHGLQLAGISNIASEVYGFQLAGLFNFSNGKLFGSQIAGFGNMAWGGKSAVQLAGVFNSSAKAQFQGAAIFNHAHVIEGIQVGSFNICSDLSGTQVGIVNSAKQVKGAQIGLINYARKANGMMLGLINVTDSIQGAAIGLINIIKNGYNRLEISGSDALYLNFGAKFGTKRLYHILHSGWSVNSNSIYSWSLGVGIGTAIPLHQRWNMHLELLTAHVNEDALWTSQLNLLNQLKLSIDFRLNDRLSVFVGPSFNLIVSELYDSETQNYGSKIMPYELYDATDQNRNIKMWIGGTAGLRF